MSIVLLPQTQQGKQQKNTFAATATTTSVTIAQLMMRAACHLMNDYVFYDVQGPVS